VVDCIALSYPFACFRWTICVAEIVAKFAHAAKPSNLPPAISMINKPSSKRNETVGTTNRSIAVSENADKIGHARLSDIDAEHEKLSMDPGRFPPWICNAHLSDQPVAVVRHDDDRT